MVKTVILTFLLFYSLEIFTQSSLSINVSYLRNYETKDLFLWKSPVNEFSSLGTLAELEYNKNFKDISYGFLSGLKWIKSIGEIDSKKINSFSYRIYFGPVVSYRLNNKLSVGFGLKIENNRDFKEFRNYTSDLIRINGTLRLQHVWYKNICGYVFYDKILTNNIAPYLINNPSNQFGVGIKYILL